MLPVGAGGRNRAERAALGDLCAACRYGRSPDPLHRARRHRAHASPEAFSAKAERVTQCSVQPTTGSHAACSTICNRQHTSCNGQDETACMLHRWARRTRRRRARERRVDRIGCDRGASVRPVEAIPSVRSRQSGLPVSAEASCAVMSCPRGFGVGVCASCDVPSLHDASYRLCMLPRALHSTASICACNR